MDQRDNDRCCDGDFQHCCLLTRRGGDVELDNWQSHSIACDGIRAIAILLVLYGHAGSTRDFPISIVGKYGSWFGDAAHLGVLVFFVISGFLITSLMVRERETTGTISLKRFYPRRILRIFPAFYAFILVLASLCGWARYT